ncbi:MAG: 16S rRNA (uracil(1498)-N(3))-methyltransferase [Treponema sp.]|jgi:16S rRNA (uracil1498-N3)-methyltransferase|nr:16S rRNA (uracil(1498)-N(3))-methyltransferase [Treponema sp.]
MKQFILPSPPDAYGTVRLEGKDYHYLVRVRRFSVGTSFTAVSPDGGLFDVTIQSIEKDFLTGSCTIINSDNEESSSPKIILFQALPKGAKMDLIVRQAAEGGLAEIVPFISEYSVPQIDGNKASSKAIAKTQRWERIIREARQQSGSSEATSIKPITDVSGIIDYWETLKSNEKNSVGILLHQDPLEQGSFHSYLSKDVDLVALLIGPEGGFSPKETDQFLKAGFKALVMGTSILRTETAALYAAAAIRIILLEKSSWMPKQPQ